VVTLDSDLPARVAVGPGNCLFVSGSCFHRRRSIRRLCLAVDGDLHQVVAHGMPRDCPGSDPTESGDARARDRARASGAGFWGIAPLREARAARPAGIELVAALDGGETASRWLGQIELLPGLDQIEIELPSVPGTGSLVAICMATYEPPGELLERQLASLREQAHRRWVCLISDDGSSVASFERLRSLTADDPRFAVSRSARRLGAYRNFERTLSMVPPQAEYVALCDQDDRWHPEKLSSLLDAIGDANLVYSDMRVVLGDSRVMSETFWSYKRNNHRNLASLLLDNTITGAASLFPRRLLDVALPFPPAFEGSYHDHWLASAALATGRIAYVDRQLYDYVQHPGAATPGHPSTEPPPARRRLRDRLAGGRVPYFRRLIRVATSARVLELRCPQLLTGGKRRAVRRVARLAEPPEPVLWLLARSLRPLVGRNETLHFERSLLKAVAWRRVSAWRARRAIRTSPTDNPAS
jgi:glycosyltransferase involved in cell wall biosynthesis